MSVRLVIPLLVVCLTSARPGHADSRFSPLAEQVLEDSTYEVYSKVTGDDKIYPAGEAFRRVVRRGRFIVTVEQARLKIRFGRGVVDFDHDSSLTEDLAGRPVQFDFVDEGKRVFGNAVRGKLDVTKIEGDETVRAERPLPYDMLTDNGNIRKMLFEAERKKKEWTLKEFSAISALDGHRTLKFRLEGTEDISFRGQKIPTYKFSQLDVTPGRNRFVQWEVTFWVDRQAVLYRLEMVDDESRTVVTFNRTK